MDRTIVILEDRLVRIEVDGELFLGVAVPKKSKILWFTRTTGAWPGPGTIVRQGRIDAWNIAGFFEQDDSFYVYGPYAECVSLQQRLAAPCESTLAALSALVDALCIMRQTSRLQALRLDSVLFLADGSILFLPQVLTDLMAASETAEERMRRFDVVNRQGPVSEASLSFTVAALLYRILTGTFPYTDAEEHLLHQKIRETNVLALHIRRPDILPDVSVAVMRSLGKDEPLCLQEWNELLKKWNTNGFFRHVSEQEARTIALKRKRIEADTEKRFSRRRFWEKNWKLFVISAVAVLAVSWFLSDVLKNLLAPRKTHGFDPEHVIEAYYRAITELDHMTMKDCVAGDAGKVEIDMVANLFVITRMRLANEGKTGFIPASDWVAQGRPAVPAEFTVFGIAELRIEKESETVYRVRYERWLPKRPADVQGRTSAGRWSQIPRYRDAEGIETTEGTGGTESPADVQGRTSAGRGMDAESPADVQGRTSAGRWSQIPRYMDAESPAETPRFEGTREENRVYLKQDGSDWVIYRFEPLSSIPIPYQAGEERPR